MDQKYCMTVQEVYGREPVAPEGWEFTGEFRPPLRGEIYLDRAHKHKRADQTDNPFPRLILKRAPTIKDIYGKELKYLKVPDGWRFTGEFREPTLQDAFLPVGMFLTPMEPPYAPATRAADGPRLILEKLPANPTIKEVYGTATPVIPKGWRFKEFRKISGDDEPGVMILTHPASYQHAQGLYVYAATNCWRGDGWRIVLEKEVDLTTLRHEVTVKDVYGTYTPTIPEGWEVVGFRDVGPYEDYLGAQSGQYSSAPWFGCKAGHPRLILKPR